MKPDWKDAPEWANWLAQDGNGAWWWYEDKPLTINGEIVWKPNGKCREAQVCLQWQDTLEQRPGGEG